MPFEHLVRPAMHARPSDWARHTVLCVEDSPAQRTVLTEQLEDAGYDVVAVGDGAAAESALIGATPHAILLDLGLPDVDGVELCRRFVEWPGCPVIIVSAERLEDRIVAAFDAGARDYVTKPFSAAVLVARLRAAIRDHSAVRRTLSDDVLSLGDVTLDVGAHELRIGGQRIDLHARPFALLEQLMRHEGVLIPYAVLAGQRRGDTISESETQALRIAISRIRKALGTGQERPRLDTEPRVGYRLVAAEG